jgi:hypothetical protein
MASKKQPIIYFIEYLIITVLSIIASFFSAQNINDSSVSFFEIFKKGVFQYVLLIFNLLAVSLIILINVKSIDKTLKQNNTISIVIYIYLIIHLLIVIDCFFINSFIMVLYGLLYLPYLPLIFVSLILASVFQLPEWILAFPIILLTNIIFSIIIRKIKYINDDNKYIVSALFYLQNNNTLAAFLLLRLIFH